MRVRPAVIVLASLLALIAVIVGWRLLTYSPPLDVVEDEARPPEWRPEVGVAPLKSPTGEAEAAPSEDAATEAQDGAVLRGRVFDADTGTGVGEVQLRARFEGKRIERPAIATTDAEGRYALAGLAEGDYLLECEAPVGYRLRSDRAERRVSVKGGAAVEGCDFALVAETPFAGTVVDEAGDPAPDATVELQGPRLFRTTTTETDGRFIFHGLGPEEDLCLLARSGDLISSPKVLRLPPEGLTDLILELSPGATVSGYVVDPAGKPVMGILVRPFPLEKAIRANIAPAETDSGGAFSVGVLPAGEYRFVLRLAGTLPHWGSDGTRIRVGFGEQLRDVVLVYERNLTISGRVVKASGEPAADVVVTAVHESLLGTITSSQSPPTLDDGLFEVRDLPEGDYTLRARHAQTGNLSEPMLDVPAGSTGISIVMPETGAVVVRGRVLDRRTGQPITSFSAAVISIYAEPTDPDSPYVEFANAEGEFELESHEAGLRRLVVTAPGYQTALAELELSPGRAPAEQLIHLESGNRVRGIVQNARGEPVSGASIVIGPATAISLASPAARSDSEGRFVLDSLPSGAVQVTAYLPGYAVGETLLSARPGAMPDLRIVLPAGATIEGVARWNGFDMANATVRVVYSSGHDVPSYQSRIGVEGAYKIKNLMPGEAYLEMIVRDAAMGQIHIQRIAVDVREQASMHIDLIAPTAGGQVSGWVLLPDDATGSAEIRVRIATSAGEQVHIGTVSGNQMFNFTNLPPGHGVLEAEAPVATGGSANVQQDFTLAPGRQLDNFIISLK